MTRDIALTIVASYADRKETDYGALLKCPKCELPSCVWLENHGAEDDLTDLEGDPIDQGWQVAGFWPEPAQPLIPESLPQEVQRIYLQAERNFPIHGNEEAAGTMYRKALDVGLKKLAPEITGTLAQRIKKLADQNSITAEMAEWSTHVRQIGNEAAHDDEAPSRHDLTELRNFSEMVMRYLFSLPAMVAARKPKP